MATLTRYLRDCSVQAESGHRGHLREQARKLPRTSRARRLDTEAQNLVIEHLSLAYRTAWYWHRRKMSAVPADEFISEAFFALVYAAGMYDPTTGVPFSAYALMVVRHRLSQTVQAALRRRALTLALDVAEDDDFLPVPVASPGRDPADVVADRDECEQIGNFLTVKSFDVLCELAKGHTQLELGRDADLTRQRIRQIEAKAIRKARQQLRGGLEVNA
jgi:RNA polymerase sigma factor (sigma-70 family)